MFYGLNIESAFSGILCKLIEIDLVFVVWFYFIVEPVECEIDAEMVKAGIKSVYSAPAERIWRRIRSIVWGDRMLEQ